LNLNAITRNTAGGTVDFLTPANIAHISTSTLNCNPTGLKQSILGGYATFGGNTWAVSNNTAGTWNIYGLGSYSTTFTANQDVDAPVNTSTINPSGSGLTINSLRFNKSTNPSTVSISSGKILTVATGGILETSTVGTRAVTISGGSSTSKLTSGGLDLIVHQNNPNASMTINANISGTNVGLTKSGAGNLILGGTTKSYTGVTTVNGGTLTLTGNINTTSGVTLNTGGTLLQNSGTALNKLITFNGGTLGGSGQYSGNINMGSSSGHLSPGDAGVGSIGTLTIGGTGNVTLGSTSVLDFDLTNTTAGNYDVLALSGTSRNLTLDGTINITSSTGVAEGNYPIITGITGTFVDNILNFGTVPSGHSSWRCYKDGTTLYVHAAPEPGTIVLLATALLSLLAYAWRKRK
jgi:autotransporter-associated beta strand protein